MRTMRAMRPRACENCVHQGERACQDDTKGEPRMTNVQQPEMRRNEHNPTVQESKDPGAAGHPRRGGKGERGRPVPDGQVSTYGPAGGPVAQDQSTDEEG